MPLPRKTFQTPWTPAQVPTPAVTNKAPAVLPARPVSQTPQESFTLTPDMLAKLRDVKPAVLPPQPQMPPQFTGGPFSGQPVPSQVRVDPFDMPLSSQKPLPPGLDPRAIAADPQGFNQWLQGYMQQPQGGFYPPMPQVMPPQGGFGSYPTPQVMPPQGGFGQPVGAVGSSFSPSPMPGLSAPPPNPMMGGLGSLAQGATGFGGQPAQGGFGQQAGGFGQQAGGFGKPAGGFGQPAQAGGFGQSPGVFGS